MCVCVQETKRLLKQTEREKGDILEVNYGEFKGRTSESK